VKAPSHHSTPFDIKMPRRNRSNRIVTQWLLDEWSLLPSDFSYPPDLHLVTFKSRLRDRECVEMLATYFRREFHYDFVQYQARSYDTQGRAFVWANPAGWVTGACHFAWRDYTDSPAAFAMSWIWLHPYVRRNGLLTRAWPFFRARFGDFCVERPLSSAMSGFLAKQEPATASQGG